MAISYKKTKVYFYQITPLVNSNDKVKANKSISDVFKFKNATHKSVPHLDGDLSVNSIKLIHSNRYCLGTFIYNQKNNVPPKYDGNKTEPVELEKNQGLGYDCCFIFDSKTNIIAIESKKPGPSLSSIKDLIVSNYDLPNFDFVMVITPTEYQKFLNSPSYYRIEYSISKPTNSTGFKDKTKSALGSTIDAMDAINAMNGTMIYSVGQSKKKTLLLKEIRQFVQNLLRWNNDEEFIKTLKVTGDDIDDHNSKVFDLVSERLVEEIEVEKRRTIGKFFTEEKYKQIQGLYLKHQPLLLKQYKI